MSARLLPIQLSGRTIQTVARQRFVGLHCGDSRDLSSVRTPPAEVEERGESRSNPNEANHLHSCLTTAALIQSTFILCDSALSKSLLRAASIERVAEVAVILLLTSAPGPRSEDTVPLVSALVTAGRRFTCGLFCANEVTLTI